MATRAAPTDRSELRRWIEDALDRHDRDAGERGETVSNVTAQEIVDAVWGRLPLEVRRRTGRAEVQASLTMLTLRRGLALARGEQCGGRDLGGRTTGHGAGRNESATRP